MYTMVTWPPDQQNNNYWSFQPTQPKKTEYFSPNKRIHRDTCPPYQLENIFFNCIIRSRDQHSKLKQSWQFPAHNYQDQRRSVKIREFTEAHTVHVHLASGLGMRLMCTLRTRKLVLTTSTGHASSTNKRSYVSFLLTHIAKRTESKHRQSYQISSW